jgi:hypothetical protein
MLGRHQTRNTHHDRVVLVLVVLELSHGEGVLAKILYWGWEEQYVRVEVDVDVVPLMIRGLAYLRAAGWCGQARLQTP